MRMQQILAVLIAVLSIVVAYANHPGENIDQYMEEQEKYFQAIDLPSAPAFTLVDSEGANINLSDFKDKVVVLNFVFTNCKNVCPMHTAVIADIQEKTNITPMKEDVQFITITTDPENDKPDVLEKYGQSHNLDPSNWKFLTTPEGESEAMTRELSEAYNVRFDPVEGGQQMHAAVTHILDRNGRFAGKFHGLKFNTVNVVLYVNGLINNWYAKDDGHSKSAWDIVMKFLFLKDE